MKPKTLDAPLQRLRGAGVRQNARNTRRALVRKMRDAERRDEKALA